MNCRYRLSRHVNPVFQKQIWYTNLAYTTFLLFGIARGFPAFLIHQLMAPGSHIRIKTNIEVSWIASLSIFPNPLGSVICGYLMDRYGRKCTIQLSMLVFAAGWAITGYARDLTMLYVGIGCVGLAIGVGACSTIYVTEICEARYRCMLLAFLEPHYSLGVLIAYVCTCYLQWKVAALVFAYLSVAFLFALFYIPETPHWLAVQGHVEDAMRALEKLRGHDRSEENKLEFHAILMSTNNEPVRGNPLVIVRDHYKQFGIMVTFHLLLQLSGYNILLVYLNTFLKSFHIQQSTAIHIVVGYSICSFVASFLTPLAVHSWPRKQTTILSSAGMALSLTLLSFYDNLSNYLRISDLWFAIPVALYVFMFSCTIGVLTLSQTMMGELYPTKVRGFMCGLTEATAAIICGFALQAVPFVLCYVGPNTICLCFSFVGLLTMYFGRYVLPETYGRSLSEIQEQYFRKSKAGEKVAPDVDQ